MCTLIISNNSNEKYPFILAANRDEFKSRKFLPPARHWPEYPYIKAGKDCLSGGSWLGVNDHNIVAAIVNRHQTLKMSNNLESLKKSRGDIVLEALSCKDISDAILFIEEIELKNYRDFYLVLSNGEESYFISAIEENLNIMTIPNGINMVTPKGLNNPSCDRYVGNIQSIRDLNLCDKNSNKWLEVLNITNEKNKRKSIRVLDSGNGYATLSQSYVAIGRETSEFLFQKVSH